MGLSPGVLSDREAGGGGGSLSPGSATDGRSEARQADKQYWRPGPGCGAHIPRTVDRANLVNSLATELHTCGRGGECSDSPTAGTEAGGLDSFDGVVVKCPECRVSSKT